MARAVTQQKHQGAPQTLVYNKVSSHTITWGTASLGWSQCLQCAEGSGYLLIDLVTGVVDGD